MKNSLLTGYSPSVYAGDKIKTKISAPFRVLFKIRPKFVFKGRKRPNALSFLFLIPSLKSGANNPLQKIALFIMKVSDIPLFYSYKFDEIIRKPATILHASERATTSIRQFTK